MICPWMLVVLLITNIVIVSDGGSPDFYKWLLYAQFLFYAAAAAGGLLLRSGRHTGVIAVPFYFLFMNYCLVRGFARFVKKDQSVLWEKAERNTA